MGVVLPVDTIRSSNSELLGGALLVGGVLLVGGAGGCDSVCSVELVVEKSIS